MKVKINSDVINEDEYDKYDRFIPGKEYTVLSVEGDSYRLLPESKRPSLYPQEKFLVTDPTIDSSWIVTPYLSEKDGQIHEDAWPVEFSRRGFFEDYFDNKLETIKEYNVYIQRLGLPSEFEVTPEGKLKRVKP